VKRKAIRKQEREVKPYCHTWSVVRRLSKRIEDEERGYFHDMIPCLMFCALTIEAYSNHIGCKKFKHWDILESLSPLDKLTVIGENIEVDIDYGRRPFQTLKELFNFRNEIAHGKTMFLNPETEISIEEAEKDKDDHFTPRPETKWEKYCRVQNVHRAIEDVEKVIKLIHDKAGIEGDYLFIEGGWITNTTWQSVVALKDVFTPAHDQTENPNPPSNPN